MMILSWTRERSEEGTGRRREHRGDLGLTSDARLLLFQPASFNPFELFSAHYFLILLTKAKPLNCPFDIPDVFMNEVSVTIFIIFLADYDSKYQLFLI
jgi:hypothetical protein